LEVLVLSLRVVGDSPVRVQVCRLSSV